MLSEKAFDLLQENGYKLISSENSIIIKQSGTTRVLIVFFTILSCLIILTGINSSPIASSILIVIILFISYKQYKIKPGNSTKTIDLENGLIHFNLSEKQLTSIESIGLDSNLVDNYTSANKTTSEEHRITILLMFKDDTVLKLLTFSCDSSEPSSEILEIYEWLKNTFHNHKSRLEKRTS